MKGNRTRHGKQADNSAHPKLAEFREVLKKMGFSKGATNGYAQGVKKYLAAGGTLDLDEADRFFKEHPEVKVGGGYRAGVMQFIRFINGMPMERRSTKVVKDLDYNNLCDDDCFNCKYPDCIKPAYSCKSVHIDEYLDFD